MCYQDLLLAIGAGDLLLFAIGAGDLGFNSRAGQIDSVANDSPPLRRLFGAVLSRRYAAEMTPLLVCKRRRSIVSIIKI